MDELERLFEDLVTTREFIETRGVTWYGGYVSAVQSYRNPADHWCWTGPSVKYKGKKDIVYKNFEGKLHRKSGPAYINNVCGSEEWYIDGELHRDDGPAITHRQVMMWYKHGALHNLHGPAIVDPAGPSQYYIDGNRLSPKEYKKEIARRRRKGLINEQATQQLFK